MTALGERIKALQKEQEPEKGMFSPEYKRAVWHLLIARGGVLPDYDPKEWAGQHKFMEFYGGVVNASTKATMKCLEDIEKYGIDWERSTDPAPSKEATFTDTFNEPEYVDALQGKLYLQDGTFTWWGCRIDTDFGTLIKLLVLNVTWEEALEEVMDRVTKADGHGDWDFQYGCRV